MKAYGMYAWNQVRNNYPFLLFHQVFLRSIIILTACFVLSDDAHAQPAGDHPPQDIVGPAARGNAPAPQTSEVRAESERERLLFDRIDQLERRLAAVESRTAKDPLAEPVRSAAVQQGATQPPAAIDPPARDANGADAWTSTGDRGVLDKPLLDRAVDQEVPSEEPQKQQSKTEWQYGGFVDLGYLLDFNHPSNRLFRSRGTAWHVDALHLNMAGAYVKKKASERSRWGTELLVHAGKDAEVFGFSATAPNIGGSKWLRHLGLANVSYLAPVGKGLTLQGGIFGSLIGYDSLYAKDNFTYTRPWGADFTPYLMMGVNASYPFNEKLTGTLFVVNGYWHLARANNVPSSGAQLAYKASPRVSVKETVLWGPHQSNTALKFWRFLSDSIVERKGDRVTFAFEYQISAERVAAAGNPRALWMFAQLPVHWTVHGPWSVTFRPEVAWDRDGRWTLSKQTVKAMTTTLEYRFPYRQTNTILRLEHRYDDSRGREGGFFRGGEVRPGVVGLTPAQHLLVFGLIFTLDSPSTI